MKTTRQFLLILIIITGLNAETLFEVKDSSNHTVLDVSTDGLRVMNYPDTLMIISSNAIRANIGTAKGLSRSFSVATSTSKLGLTKVFDVGLESTKMRESGGNEYTDFSPINMFLGLNAGASIDGGKYNVFIGNYSGNTTTGPDIPDMFDYGYYNTFIGFESGRYATNSFHNTYIGANSGRINSDGSDNTFLGSSSGAKNTGGNNTFLGSFAGGASNGAGSSNTFVGCTAGNYTTSGSNNVYVGHGAGEGNQTGYDNVYIGRYAGGSNVTGYGNICIGRSAGSEESGSNKLYIANSDTSTPLIKGTFPNTDLNFTANTVTVVHPLGETTNGLKIQTTYNSNADSWHLYQQTDDELGLYYNTNLRGSWNITSGAYTSVSDLKLKKNIEDVADVTDKVMLLQPKRYNFKNQNDNEKKYMGLIAQDVEKLFPEFVNFHKESDTYTIDYAGLSVVAIQAIKEQQAEIIKLSKRLDEIEKKLNISK